MDMNYDILSYDELPADEAAMLKADAEEAERGYTDEQLSEALKRTPGRPAAESLLFFNLRYTADVRVSRRPAHEAAAARRWARRRVEPVEHVAGPGPTRGREPHSQSGSMPIRSRAVCGTGLSRALRNSSNALDGRRVTVSSSIPR